MKTWIHLITILCSFCVYSQNLDRNLIIGKWTIKEVKLTRGITFCRATEESKSIIKKEIRQHFIYSYIIFYTTNLLKHFPKESIPDSQIELTGIQWRIKDNNKIELLDKNEIIGPKLEYKNNRLFFNLLGVMLELERN